MKSRLANLKLNERAHEEQLKDKQQEIEKECVSLFSVIFKADLTYYYFKCSNEYWIYLLYLGRPYKRTKQHVFKSW